MSREQRKYNLFAAALLSQCQSRAADAMSVEMNAFPQPDLLSFSKYIFLLRLIKS